MVKFRQLLLCAVPLLVQSCDFFWNYDLYTIPRLTREQMYADYDCMTSIIRDGSPFIILQAKAFGTDMMKILTDERLKIEAVANAADFKRFIQLTLARLRSQHLDLADYYGPPDEDIVENTLHMTLLDREYMIENLIFTSWDIPAWYINGKYKTLSAVASGAVTVPAGSSLVAVDGTDIHSIIDRLIPHGSFYRDFANGRFYGYNPVKRLSTNLYSQQPGLHRWSFIDPSGIPLDLSLDATDTITLPERGGVTRSAAVRYLRSRRALYVKLSMMNQTTVETMIPAIKTTYEEGPVERIVIDITDNPGGSDYAWHLLLSVLQDRNLTITAAVGIRDTPVLRNALSRTSHMALFDGKSMSIPQLDGQEFLVTEESFEIKKRDDSLNFTGPIYVVVNNIYSSAGSFLAYTFQNDQLISIGNPPGCILGMGIDPLLFTLPNSKIRFRMEPIVDLTHRESMDGLLGRRVEREVVVSDVEWLTYLNHAGDLSDERYLTEINPFTSAALR